MERIFLFFFVIVTVTGFKHHLKSLKSDESDVITKVVCDNAFAETRNELIEKSKCSEPKEVFVELNHNTSYLHVRPSHVWVKRCVGLCDYHIPGSQCVPIQKRKQSVPVRILNLHTNLETCSTYAVEVHESCGCCITNECGPRRTFNPRKCSCQCPNLEERRNCLKQRNQHMKWNPSKCSCEKRKGTR